jgi:hypothetical protein
MGGDAACCLLDPARNRFSQPADAPGLLTITNSFLLLLTPRNPLSLTYQNTTSPPSNNEKPDNSNNNTNTHSTPDNPKISDSPPAQHARLVIVPGIAPDRTLNTLSIEYITGGEITTSKSAHLSSPLYPQPHFKLWIATNQLPTVRHHSAGAWRRIKLIHFPVSFLRREDKNLATKLQSCAPAILNWAIQGCLTWQREGLLEPPRVQLATSGYQDTQDPLAGFLHNCCQFGPQFSVKAGELYKAYQFWCQFIGENKPLDAKSFGLQMLAHGYLRVRKYYGNIYLGLNLRVSLSPPSTTDSSPLSIPSENA